MAFESRINMEVEYYIPTNPKILEREGYWMRKNGKDFFVLRDGYSWEIPKQDWTHHILQNNAKKVRFEELVLMIL